MKLSQFKNKRVLVSVGLVVLLGIVVLIIALLFQKEGGRPQKGQQTTENENINLADHPGLTEAEIKEIRGAPDELTEKYKLDRPRILRNEANEYRIRARFPDNSYPITRQTDPVFNEFTPSQPMTRHPENPNGPFLVQYLDKISQDPSELLVIHAFLLDEEKQKLETKDLQAQLTIGGAGGRILATINMKDDGAPGDTKAGDLIYTAAFRLPSELQQPDVKPTNYTVIIKAGKLMATNVFSVGYLNIAHTGRYTDRVETDAKGSHLLVEAEFDVKKAGFYHVQASLYSLEGEAIGWAQDRVQLETGKHMVPLRFYGKLLCDKGVDGPYVVQHLAYQNVNVMPGVRSQVVMEAHRTSAYPSSTFTCASFDNPDYMAKAAQADQDALQAQAPQ